MSPTEGMNYDTRMSPHTRLFSMTIWGMDECYMDMPEVTDYPIANGGDSIGAGIWYKVTLMPAMLLWSGALPSELK